MTALALLFPACKDGPGGPGSPNDPSLPGGSCSTTFECPAPSATNVPSIARLTLSAGGTERCAIRLRTASPCSSRSVTRGTGSSGASGKVLRRTWRPSPRAGARRPPTPSPRACASPHRDRVRSSAARSSSSCPAPWRAPQPVERRCSAGSSPSTSHERTWVHRGFYKDTSALPHRARDREPGRPDRGEEPAEHTRRRRGWTRRSWA